MEAIQRQTQNRNESEEVLATDLKRLSFRDPAGTVYAKNDTIVRTVTPKVSGEIQSVLRSKVVQKWVGSGKLISTEEVSPLEFHHPRIFFPSYPFEWCPEMLYQAATLTLDFFSEALSEGYGLKDASSRNILFSGNQEVFIDILSLEKRHPNDATWLPFEQFLRNFVYPLGLVRAKRSNLRNYFLSSTDGKSPVEVAEQMGLKTFYPRYFSLVGIPYLLSKLVSRKRMVQGRFQRFTSTSKEAQFILKILIKHLRNGLERIAPVAVKASPWKNYDTSDCPYTPKALELKENLVKGILASHFPKSVLDLGCNQGKFSLFAAERGAKVVSLDSDSACISALWKSVREKRLDVLPLCMELNEPSPGLGWKNSETLSFLDRAANRFEMTLSLALFHHLILQSIPLDEVLSFIAHTTHRYAVVEYVGPEDRQVKQGLAQRGNSIQYPSKDEFLEASKKHFKVEERFPLFGMERELFFLSKLSAN